MGFHPASKKELPHIAWTVYCLVPYENHVNITKTLGQGQKVECKGFTYKDFKYTPVYWDRCQAKSGKLMFMANYTIVNWGPHSMCVSNCLDDINSTMCDYASIEGY